MVEITYTEEKLEEINQALRSATKEMPEQQKGFRSLMGGVLKEGHLDLKTKELITISLGVISGCEWCIILHVKKALDAGATREEILEAGYVAVLMGGGPALMHFIPMLKALDDLTEGE